MPSGNPDDIRPNAETPWSTDNPVALITIKLSENLDNPEYVKTITLSNMENLDDVELRVLKDVDGDFIPTTIDQVRIPLNIRYVLWFN